MPRLAHITVYPIKSFDGVAVDESSFAAGGGLGFDRRFALRNAAGRFVNGKGFPAIHAIRARFDLSQPATPMVTLAAPENSEQTFELRAGEKDLERWCGAYFGFEVSLVEEPEFGFPDDLNASGPTVVSTASLREVAAWFPPFDLDEVRRRFRANLEIDGDADDCPAFWEDRLFAADAAPDARMTIPFRIGDVRIEGVNPCARCVVPTRNSQTGDVRPRFAQEFQQRRAERLPSWAERSAFDHFYRLTVNTRVPPSQTGKTIRVGDRVTVDATY